MRAISLFSGVGGIEQGFDRAGIETVLQVEQDSHALSVLARHWPDTERLTDVRSVVLGSFGASKRVRLDGHGVPDGDTPATERDEQHPEGSIDRALRGSNSVRAESAGRGEDHARSGSGESSTGHEESDLRGEDGTDRSERDRSAGGNGARDRCGGTGGGVDLIYGGFPCQDVSVAGKRRGLEGDRSGLWFEFERILSELRPRWAIIENVPGLLSSNGGNDFRVILDGLCELGYSVGWTILDAQNFGVPQRRRRVFVVAGPGVESVRAVLSLCESCGGDTAPSRSAGEEVAGTLGGGSQSGERGYRNDLDGSGAFVAKTLLSGGNDKSEADRMNYIAFSGGQSSKARSLGISDKVTPPLKAAESGSNRVPLIAATLRSRESSEGVNMPGRGGEDDANLVVDEQKTMFDAFNFVESDLANTVVDDKYRKDYVVETTGALPASLENGLGNTQTDVAGMLIAATIDTDPERHIGRGDGSENLVMGSLDTHLGDKQWLEDQSVEKFGQMEDAGAGVRRLTPRECERLMGWPDDWTRWDANGKEIADSHRYRMCGNGVVSPVAEWIGRQLVAVDATL